MIVCLLNRVRLSRDVLKLLGSPANDLYMKYDKGLEPLFNLEFYIIREVSCGLLLRKGR